jgi:MFS family permease
MRPGRWSRILILLASVLLWGGSLAYLGKGFAVAWQGGDSDLRIREREWVQFEKGVYPNRRLEQPVKSPVHSVYPPWALPMFAPFFGAGNFTVARIVLQALSLAGLAAMMWLGWRELAPRGWQAGLLGAAMASAISGNCTAIALGQFSILCAGLLAAQVLAMKGNQPVLAGLCWALAMIKPQIALPFALLFLLERQWRGLIAGGALLGALSAGAFWWTGVSPLDFFAAGPATEKLRFVRDAGYVGTMWIEWLDLPPRTATGIALGVLAACGLVLLLRDWRGRIALLHGAGICAMLGFVLFYHRQYDNQMLFPLMLAMAAVALRFKTPVAISLAGLLALSLYLPAGMVARSEVLSVLAFLAPVAAAGFLLFARHSPAVKNDLPEDPADGGGQVVK